jgi:hypothetical protein
LAWIDYLEDLDPNRRDNVVGDVLDCFNRTGLYSPEEAAPFLDTLRTIGDFQPGNIVARLHPKMRDRDALSQLAVIMAFLQLGLARPDLTDFCGALAGGLARKCAETDKSCRALIEAHVKFRFAPETQEYRARLEQLCNAAGPDFPRPEAAPELRSEPGTKPDGGGRRGFWPFGKKN